MMQLAFRGVIIDLAYLLAPSQPQINFRLQTSIKQVRSPQRPLLA
jgi:hypothetical protein